MENTILFHGSTKIIERPKLGVGNPKNDYGLGFYCTEHLDLAKEWACTDHLGGFANKKARRLSFSYPILGAYLLSKPSIILKEWHVTNKRVRISKRQNPQSMPVNKSL